jgi:hypothetical protein
VASALLDHDGGHMRLVSTTGISRLCSFNLCLPFVLESVVPGKSALPISIVPAGINRLAALEYLFSSSHVRVLVGTFQIASKSLVPSIGSVESMQIPESLDHPSGESRRKHSKFSITKCVRGQFAIFSHGGRNGEFEVKCLRLCIS